MNPKLHPGADLRLMHARILSVGFQSEIAPMFRDDPRGPEYGCYRVAIVDSDNIKVSYFQNRELAALNLPGNVLFQMHFLPGANESALENFMKWVANAF